MENKISLKEKILNISNDLRIKKEGKNTFSKYDYFTPDDILSNLNPLLHTHKVFCHFDLLRNDNEYKATLTVSDCSSEQSLIYNMETPPLEIRGANPVQAVGGLMTYCKRYLLMNAFNIADNKDDLDAGELNKKVEIAEKKKETIKQIIKETPLGVVLGETKPLEDIQEAKDSILINEFKTQIANAKNITELAKIGKSIKENPVLLDTEKDTLKPIYSNRLELLKGVKK